MEVKGYKAFNRDMTNRYGIPFEIGATYRVTGDIKFGNDGNGFHMCKELSDVFRYFMDEDPIVAKVTGRGECVKCDDEYNGYYDMYAVSEITIDAILSREDILNLMLQSHEIANKKFLSTYHLNDEEKAIYMSHYQDNFTMLQWILYYQSGYKDIFCVKREEGEAILRKVFKNGQNNN